MKTELKIGMIVKDNDPREPDRMMVIVGFDDKGRAILRTNLRSMAHETRASDNRIQTDGKPRRSGRSVLPPDAIA